MRRSRSPELSNSSKRARRSPCDTSNTNNVPQNDQTGTIQAISMSPALHYPFVVPLVAKMLRDGDVLVGILPTTKRMTRLISGYVVKGEVKQSNVRSSDVGHSLQLSPVDMRDVTNLNLAHHTLLKSARLEEDSDVVIITPDMFPVSLTELHLSTFNQLITPGMFPAQLKKLSLGHFFNQPVPVGSFPESLEELEFGCGFSEALLDGALPSSLTSLKFDKIAQFSEPIDPGVLPDSLTTLVLPMGWNQPLARPQPLAEPPEKGTFPPNLETL